MNIFVVNSDPKKAAAYLDDKRVVKGVLEMAQMLSTTMYKYNNKGPYKPTHANHPCTKWVSENLDNYYWAWFYYAALAEEYQKRFGRKHKSWELANTFWDFSNKLPSGQQTPFPNCARNKAKHIDCTNINNIYQAYHEYLQKRWQTDKRKPTWYGQPNEPKWEEES